ncbi:unnamed protein product [Durusdinium trenchii]|uniref:Ubiquitin-like domain-containing protein n=2 Tax=Durusdinium trenchii TaxID=1381693 RepID=A0ABP0NYI2_9DINO
MLSLQVSLLSGQTIEVQIPPDASLNRLRRLVQSKLQKSFSFLARSDGRSLPNVGSLASEELQDGEELTAVFKLHPRLCAHPDGAANLNRRGMRVSFLEVRLGRFPRFCSMEVIRRQAAFAQEKGLFKAARAWHVSANFVGWKCAETSCSTLPQVSEVDFFISHSWACPSWKKFLAACFHLNLDAAIVLSNLTCFGGVLILRAHAGSFVGIASACQGWLQSALMFYPMGVFLATFFFGHLVSRRSFWIDGVCINEETLLAKYHTIQAIPAFVAYSKQMLVLWDCTYLERLWCLYEIAVFAKTSQTHDTTFVPIWAAIWTLTTMIAIFLASVSYLDTLPPHLDLDTEGSLFLSWFKSTWGPPEGCVIAALPFSWFCLQKLHGHERMLNQISNFDFRNAKCTLETDRVTIEQQVVDLFDEALEGPASVALSFDMEEVDASRTDAQMTADPLLQLSPRSLQSFRHVTSYPSRGEVVDQFNSYVRGPLRQRVLGLVGSEVDIPFKWCLTVMMPAWWSAWAMVLGCENRDCHTSCSQEGSVPQLVLGTLFTTVVLLLVQGFQATAVGGLAVIVTKSSWPWLLGYMAGLALIFWQVWWFFFRKASALSQRPLLRA